jgi:predicted ABC-type ATPase
MGADWKSVEAQVEAGRIVLKRQRECLEQGLSFNQETTLCGGSIVRAIKEAKNLGYFIIMSYVGVNNPEIAKARVAKRIALGGHGVSEGTVERRYSSSMENLIKLLPLCDKVNIYDNSGSELILVAYGEKTDIKRTSEKCEWADKLLADINQ